VMRGVLDDHDGVSTQADANTRPNRVSRLTEKPNAAMPAKGADDGHRHGRGGYEHARHLGGRRE